MTRENAERLAYRIDEAAKCIGVCQRTIYNLIAAGRLRPVKIGRCTMIPAADLRAIMEPK